MHLICLCGAIQSVVMLEPVDVYLGKKDKENLMSTKAFNFFQYISVGFFSATKQLHFYSKNYGTL